VAFKFNWMWAVSRESPKRLTSGQKHILMHCAVFGVRNDGNTFRARQKTIADNCGTSRKAVNEALGAGSQLGYLFKSQPRAQGPGQHGGDEWTLTLPEWCHDSLQHNESEWSNESLQHPQSGVTESTECCNENDPSGVTESTECCNPDSAPTSDNDTLTGLVTGLYNGFEERGSGRSVFDRVFGSAVRELPTAPAPQTPSDRTDEVIDAEVIDEDEVDPNLEAVCRAIGKLTRDDFDNLISTADVSRIAFGDVSGRNLQKCRQLMDGLVPIHLEVVNTTPNKLWRRRSRQESSS
jgi:hypothetical protein